MAVVVEEQLKSSLAALQHHFSPANRNDACGNPSRLVVFAEHAVKVSWLTLCAPRCPLASLLQYNFFFVVQNGHRTIAMESLQLYHTLNPPQNQFFIRAYLCEAMVSSKKDKISDFTEVFYIY